MIEINSFQHQAKAGTNSRNFPSQMKHRLGLDFFNAEESIYSGDPFDLYNWLRNTDTPVEKTFRYPGIGNILIPVIKNPTLSKTMKDLRKK